MQLAPLGHDVTRPLGRPFCLRFVSLINVANFLHRMSRRLPNLRHDFLGILHHEGADRADHDARDQYDQSDHFLLLNKSEGVSEDRTARGWTSRVGPASRWKRRRGLDGWPPRDGA